MEASSPQVPNNQLPSVDGQGQALPAQDVAPEAPTVPESTADPKLALAQYTAAAEVVIARTGQSPRARADELAALRAKYVQARFGISIQAAKS